MIQQIMFLLVQIFMVMFPRILIITSVGSIWFFFQWPLPHLLLGQAVCHHIVFQSQQYFSSPSWRGWKSCLNSNVYKKHTSNHVPNVRSNLMFQYYTDIQYQLLWGVSAPGFNFPHSSSYVSGLDFFFVSGNCFLIFGFQATIDF